MHAAGGMFGRIVEERSDTLSRRYLRLPGAGVAAAVTLVGAALCAPAVDALETPSAGAARNVAAEHERPERSKELERARPPRHDRDDGRHRFDHGERGGRLTCDDSASRDDESHDRSKRAGSRRECRDWWRRMDRHERARIAELHDRLKRIPRDRREAFLQQLRDADPDAVESMLEEWKQLSGLDPSERQAAIRRIREARYHLILEHELDRVFRHSRKRHLPEDLRERLERLGPDERRAELRRFLDESRRRFDERRREMIAELPRGLQERVREFAPHEQVEFLRRYRSHELLNKVFPGSRDREKLARVGPDVLLAMLQAKKEETEGPKRPAFLDEESWKRWLELEGFERARLIRHLQHVKRRCFDGKDGPHRGRGHHDRGRHGDRDGRRGDDRDDDDRRRQKRDEA